jgi:LytS/YehU family sensor histidine kinase
MGKDYFVYFAWDQFGNLNKALYAGAGTLWNIFPPLVLKLLRATSKNIQRQKDLLAENNKFARQDTHAHLPPGLVFNTLQHIRQKLSANPAAQNATAQLSSLLDFAFYKSQQRAITIQEEIAFLESYIGFERMRHSSNRVTITFEHYVSSNVSLPPLLFINFIENAFKHGINSTIRQSWVKIHLEEKAGVLTFNVQNSTPEKVPPSNGGIGLKNVRRRLELEFPGRFTLHEKKTDIFEIDLIIDLP